MGVDHLAAPEGGLQLAKGLLSFPYVEPVAEQHPGHRHRSGRIDHRRQAGLGQGHRAEVDAIAEGDGEGVREARTQHGIAARERLGLDTGVVADVRLVQGRQAVNQRRVDPEPPHLHPGGDARPDPGDEGVVVVEHDRGPDLLGQPAQQGGRGVDLGEAVELVPSDIEQQGVGRRHGVGEPQGVRLVELEDRGVGVEPARGRDDTEHRGDDAPGEVAPRRVGEHPPPVRAEHRDEHLRRRGLPVRPADDDHPAGQVGEHPGEEAGVEPFDDQARQRRPATAQPRGRPGGLADRDGGPRPQHRSTLVAPSPILRTRRRRGDRETRAEDVSTSPRVHEPAAHRFVGRHTPLVASVT